MLLLLEAKISLLPRNNMQLTLSEDTERLGVSVEGRGNRVGSLVHDRWRRQTHKPGVMPPAQPLQQWGFPDRRDNKEKMEST